MELFSDCCPWLLKGHFAKVKCLERLLSLSRSKSRLCQSSEIVFLSSVALLKHKICRKAFGPISVLIPYYFYASWLANKGCKFSLMSAGWSWASIDGLLRVALRIEFEHPVVLVHSYVHDRLRPREMIGFTDNSRLLSWIQIPGYG